MSEDAFCTLIGQSQIPFSRFMTSTNQKKSLAYTSVVRFFEKKDKDEKEAEKEAKRRKTVDSSVDVLPSATIASIIPGTTTVTSTSTTIPTAV